jgi:predicted metal-dependent hydrolase
VLPPLESLVEAQRLLDLGRPFHAHEVLEGTWKAAPPDERDLWQGLAQLAVGLTHLARGNRTGAATLLLRGAARIGSYDDQPYDIDVPALVSFARRTAEALEAGAEPSQVMPPLRHEA